jgi:hypothetical protein
MLIFHIQPYSRFHSLQYGVQFVCPYQQYAHVSTEILSSGSIASASAWLPLLYDTYIFGLTLNRTLPSIRNKEAGHVIHTLFADGLLYYRCANRALLVAGLTVHTVLSAP